MANFGLLVFCPEIISISLGLLVMIYILLQTFLFLKRATGLLVFLYYFSTTLFK